MKKNQNIFDKLAFRLRGNPLTAWVFILSLCLFFIGLNGFREDAYSSYRGLALLEENYGIVAASWDTTRWGLSIFLQVTSILAFVVYFVDRKEYWYAFWVAIVAQSIDVFADYVYRSGGFLNVSGILDDPARFIWAMVLTAFYTFVGSECAISFGFGATKALFPEGLKQIRAFIDSVVSGLRELLKRGSVPKGENMPSPRGNRTLEEARFRHGLPPIKRPIPTFGHGGAIVGAELKALLDDDDE